jgi:hypothetical protein
MMNLGGVKMHAADISQVAGIDHIEFRSGKAKGVEAFEVRTGSGLQFTVLKDRALDIPRAQYKGCNLAPASNTGIVAPQYFEPEGESFFRNWFVGLLCTCGLTYAGVPCEDEGKQLGLHGRIGNTAAEEVGYEQLEENGEIEFRIKGKVREAAYYNEYLCSNVRLGPASKAIAFGFTTV